jgi:hypothetical protein
MLTTKEQYAAVFLVTQLRANLVRDMIAMQEVGNDQGVECLNAIDFILRDVQDVLRQVKKPEDVEFTPKLIDHSMPDAFPEGHILPGPVVKLMRDEFEKAKAEDH